MATVTFADNDEDTAAGTTYQKVLTVNPSAGDLIIAAAMWTGSPSGAYDFSDNRTGGSYAVVASASKGSGDAGIIFGIRENTVSQTGVSYTMTASCAGDAATGSLAGYWRIPSWSGSFGAAAVRQVIQVSDQAAGTPSGSFPGACLTGNPVLTFVGCTEDSPAASGPSGWTKDFTTGYTVPTSGGMGAHRDSGFTGTTVTWGGSVSGGQWGMVAIELDVGTQDATVSAATIAAIASLSAATPSGGASVAPSAVAGVASLGTVAVSGGARPTPTVVASVASVGAVTVSTQAGATVTPAAVAGVASVGTTSVSGGAQPTPSVIAGVSSVGTATVSGGARVTPTAVAGSATVPAPTVSTAGNVNITPSTVAGVSSLPAATVSGGARPTPSVIAGATTVGTAVAGGGATVTPTRIAATAAVGLPAISAAAVITPATLSALASLAAPTVRGGATVVGTTIDTFTVVYLPTVTTGSEPDAFHISGCLLPPTWDGSLVDPAWSGVLQPLSTAAVSAASAWSAELIAPSWAGSLEG